MKCMYALTHINRTSAVQHVRAAVWPSHSNIVGLLQFLCGATAANAGPWDRLVIFTH